MPISTLRVFSLALLVASQFLSSQGNGTSVYNFLAREYSPRSAALAGNSGLYGGDVDVLLSNPGALVSVENTQISAAYSRLFMDFSSAFIAYVSTPGQYGSFAVSLIYFDYGSFAETDVLGTPTGASFSASESAFLLSYAKTLEENISFGVNGKVIMSNLADRSSYGLALDMALDWAPDFLNRGRIYVMLANFGGQVSSYYDTKEDLPMSLHLGISHRPEHLPITLGLRLKDINYDNQETFDFAKRFVLSAEFNPLPALAIRLGYDNQKREDLTLSGGNSFSGVSLGFGLAFRQLRFDYAFVVNGVLENEHQLGLNWSF
jgi:hypothetical protein